ncbi:MAG: hypothetical protein MOGMAGMI_01207 [Candidatus Omnitrophica bacterium]|nr:hypothetical protein [Candidatus Omnitrophota bacterium]
MKARLDQRTKLRRRIIRAAVLLSVLGLIVLTGWRQKERLASEAILAIERLFLQETDLELHLGEVQASWSGTVRIAGLTLSDPDLAGTGSEILRVEELVLRYPILDLLSKSPSPDLSVEVRGARLWWRPHIGLRRPKIPLLDRLSEWMQSSRGRLRLTAPDAEVSIGMGRKDLKGIALDVDGRNFRIEVPFDHVDVMGSDVSTTLVLEGQYHRGVFGGTSVVEGRLSTQGTVVNWSPLKQESEMDLRLDEEGLDVLSTSALGGLYIAGHMDLRDTYDMDMVIAASDYPIDNLAPFFKSAAGEGLPGRLDLEAHVQGYPVAPSVDLRVRVHDTWMGSRSFKAADVQLEGVFPTFRVASARMVLESGEAMRLPEATVEASDLLRVSTYEKLLAGATQDTVILGEWEFTRAEGAFRRNDFQMRKGFGEQAGILVRKPTNRDPFDPRLDRDDVRVGFEYRLPNKESVKFEVKEDERFVGVERKWNF